MNEAILIYLYLTAVKMLGASIAITAIVALLLSSAYLIALDNIRSSRGEESPKSKYIVDKSLGIIKFSLILFFVSLTLQLAIPSKADIAYIVGGSVAINVASDNKEELEKLPKNILKVTNSFLEGIEDKEEKKND